MGYSQRFKKEGCTSAADVNWKKILDLTKVQVPQMIVSAFQRKVAAATQPFDVLIEVDDAAGKGRLVVKKLASGEAVFDWLDAAAVETRKKLAKVKLAIQEFAKTNAGFLRQMDAEKDRVKMLKEAVKAIEAGVGKHDPDSLLKEIHGTRDGLAAVIKDGGSLFTKFNAWYLDGPRKGVGPLLAAADLKEDKLAKEDREALVAPVHQMSSAGNDVLHMYRSDIEGAAETLLVRLVNLESQIGKSHEEALEDIRKNLDAGVQRIKIVIEQHLAAMKLTNVHELLGQFKAKKGDKFERLSPAPKFVAAEIESQKTRLGGIPVKIADIEKQVSRLVQTVPPAFQGDRQVMGMTSKLMALVDENKRNLLEGQALLHECSGILSEYAHE